MAETIDQISIDYEEDGIQITKELDREILSKGAWTTILFKYQTWNRKDECYGDDVYTIRRYRKMKGEYRQQSKFNISSKAQAQKIIDALQNWIKED